MERRVFLWTLLFLFVVHKAMAMPLTSDSSIAVMDFGTRPGATPAEISLQNTEYTSSEYLILRFVDRNCFSVMDKDLVMHKMREEGLQTTGIIDPDTAKRIGAMLGVRYIVYGNVVNVSLSNVGTQVLASGVNVCTVKARIVARIMDVETGDILMVTRGEGASKSSYTKIQLGMDPLLSASTVTIGTKKVTMDSVHNAIQKAAYHTVDQMVEKLLLKPQ